MKRDRLLRVLKFKHKNENFTTFFRVKKKQQNIIKEKKINQEQIVE